MHAHEAKNTSVVFSSDSNENQLKIFGYLYDKEIKNRFPIVQENFFRLMRETCTDKTNSRSTTFYLDRLIVTEDNILIDWDILRNPKYLTNDPRKRDWKKACFIEDLWALHVARYLKDELGYDIELVGLIWRSRYSTYGPSHFHVFGNERYEIKVKWD